MRKRKEVEKLRAKWDTGAPAFDGGKSVIQFLLSNSYELAHEDYLCWLARRGIVL